MENTKLVDIAIQASENAYAPYSKFKVGAAVLLTNGKVITGANIENASFSLTNCAERSALFYIYSQGYRKTDIAKIVVIADTEHAVSPCGACRQVMSELLDMDCPIILANKTKTDIKETNIQELLPYMFIL
ncbi:cytidine deaminase [Allofrancisella guangzhouensis]|uniref:Cytidine deaminase n=1 Tax=Allofrancisella guangzhouensis TaxID=594679 RepID=A0A0A8E6M9_9GAMM|nr:cytidine deaminase [Allofrancisella guangzhouensis]AJC49257.1 cytidine deaminase [Allofrancisella guangzhouensis]MBK2027699.1 cytidine deaminase [Allofrancisella guangzhouensis]MBK2044887.1 cytidine deaminase [Allofrancisella guangzhouensis]MBK2046412.1 cytidine deaminase [Allofrancisella guangzhouensis]